MRPVPLFHADLESTVPAVEPAQKLLELRSALRVALLELESQLSGTLQPGRGRAGFGADDRGAWNLPGPGELFNCLAHAVVVGRCRGEKSRVQARKQSGHMAVALPWIARVSSARNQAEKVDKPIELVEGRRRTNPQNNGRS